MNMFVQNLGNQPARTENGMKARASSNSPLVDLFYKMGASRGRDIIPLFAAAYADNPDKAIRIALWARDIRGGAGERDLFRQILGYLVSKGDHRLTAILGRTAEVGRYDDILTIDSPEAIAFYASRLVSGDGLAAKWAPRKGPVANKLRKFLGLTPKQYRRLVVDNTKVVETQMCAGQWDDINFSHVPSQAARIYRKAFYRHTPKYQEYIDALKARVPNEKSDVKVNADAIYPHDVLKDYFAGRYGYSSGVLQYDPEIIKAQWDALPNYMKNGGKVLPVVDTSGSMGVSAGGGTSVTCMMVAVSLGLYMADKNQGAFKDTFVTFSEIPNILNLRGDILAKVDQMVSSDWGFNTNLHAVFERVLNHATQFNVAPQDMPETIMILSDMQFDNCVTHDDSAIEMIRRKYQANGYEVPRVVFWNLRDAGNVPVSSHESGTALVSGFSPAILKAVLAADMEEFTPAGIMNKTIMIDRYKTG